MVTWEDKVHTDAREIYTEGWRRMENPLLLTPWNVLIGKRHRRRGRKWVISRTLLLHLLGGKPRKYSFRTSSSLKIVSFLPPGDYKLFSFVFFIKLSHININCKNTFLISTSDYHSTSLLLFNKYPVI